MKCHVYNENGMRQLGVVEAEPQCGKDFCDTCGDCLHCYISDPCPSRTGHQWVVYRDERNVVPFLTAGPSDD